MFLAGPFKALVDPVSKSMSPDDIERFTRIIEHFEAKGWTVHCAHKREQWGREFMTPDTCTKIDFDEISTCDCFVAFPGVPASPGTHIEMGWASALKKPIVLLLEEARDYAFLVQGLGVISKVARVRYGGSWADPSLIDDAIASLGIGQR